MVGSIAVQAFNKAKSVVQTLDSIVRARGSSRYHLFILQDGCLRSRHTEKYRAAWEKTTRVIESWISANCNYFASVCFEWSNGNNGPYRGAERLINWALGKSNSVVFSEDDMIFENDALEWFDRVLVHPAFLRSDVWAIAGESKFFDSNRHVPSDSDICRALEVAQTQSLIDRFVYLDFLPSSCFATTRAKWAEFGKTRGTTNGDRAVLERCRAEGKLCVWPVIARCRDTGMHHPLGYSVRWKGLHHAGFKNSYIVSGMLKRPLGRLSELTTDETGDLFTEFTHRWEDQKMNGVLAGG
jgi:hypothetical protein